MNSFGKRGPHIALCVITLGSILALFGQPFLWQLFLGPMHNLEVTEYPFHDMGARLNFVQMMAEGVDIYEAGNHKPSYTIYMMHLFSLDRSDRIPVGFLFVGIFTFWNLWLLRPKRILELLLALSVLLSPPCLLLIERANDDIIIYAFICFVPLLLQMHSSFGRMCGWGLVSAVLPMKYYPSAAYALLLHREHSFKRIAFFVLLSIAFLGVLSALIAQEVSQIHGRIPVASIFCSFGARIFFDLLNLDVELSRVFVLCGLGGVLSVVTYILFKAKAHEIRATPRSESFFLLGSSMLTFCFFMNGNWDYRMAFLIPTIPLAFEWMASSSRRDRILVAVYFSSMLLTLWPEYLYYLSVLEGYSDWVHKKDLHLTSLFVKQAASWVMIGSQMLIAAYILQPDVRSIIQDFRKILSQEDSVKQS